VLIDAETHTMELIVPDDKLSLAIGKKGQNVRLASQLTGWKIDIHSETKVRELEERAKQSMASLDGLDQDMAETLFKLGWRSPSDLAEATPEELAAVPGLGGTEAAKRIVRDATALVAAEQKRAKEESERQAREAQKSPEERMLSVKGIGPAILESLHKGGYKTVEQLAREQDLQRLSAQAGLQASKASSVRHQARIYIGQLPPDAPEPEVADDEPAPAGGPPKSELDARWDLK
jgi:N utilization substance protein A